MSNRNFDSSMLSARLRDKAIAKSYYQRTIQNNLAAGNPQSANFDFSIIPEMREGTQKQVTQNLLGGGYCQNNLNDCSTECNPAPTDNQGIPPEVNKWITAIIRPIQENSYTLIRNVSYDADDNLYIVGYYTKSGLRFYNAGIVDPPQSPPVYTLTLDAGNTYYAFIAKYDVDGIFQWVAPIATGLTTVYNIAPTNPAPENIIPIELYVDGTTLYVGGACIKGPTVFYQGQNATTLPSVGTSISPLLWGGQLIQSIFVSSYDALNGTVNWATKVTPSASTALVTPDNTAYLTGICAVGNSVYISCNVNLIFYVNVPNPPPATLINPVVYSTDSSTHEFFPLGAAAQYNANGSINPLIIKFDNTGVYTWLTTLHGHLDNVATHVCLVDSSVDNGIYVCGTYIGGGVPPGTNSTTKVYETSSVSAPYDVAPTVSLNSTDNTKHGYIVNYDSNGLFVWVAKVGGNDEPTSAADDVLCVPKRVTSDTNYVYLTGYIYSTNGNNQTQVMFYGGTTTLDINPAPNPSPNPSPNCLNILPANANLKHVFICKYKKDTYITLSGTMFDADESVGFNLVSDDTFLYVTGYYYSSPYAPPTFAITTLYDGTQSGPGSVGGALIYSGADGTTYTSQTVYNYNVFLARYSIDGTSDTLELTGNWNTSMGLVALNTLDKDGPYGYGIAKSGKYVVVVGDFVQEIGFNQADGTNFPIIPAYTTLTDTTTNTRSGFLVRYSINGQLDYN